MIFAVFLCAAVALLCAGYPMYVIRPFRAQGAEELAVALVVRSWAPVVSGVAAVVALGLTAALWRRGRRVAGVIGSGLAVVAAALTHVNVYEKMFHRIDSVATVGAAEAKIDADDMVLAIEAGGYARAYPIRMMGYHHIANDTVGDRAVVATY